MPAAGDISVAPQFAQAQATSNLALTTTHTDIPGATLSVTVGQPNAKALIVVTVDFTSTGTTATTAVAQLSIDGVEVGPQAIWNQSDAAAGARVTAGTAHVATLGVGVHTVKLVGWQASGATSMIRANNLHTQLSILMFE